MATAPLRRGLAEISSSRRAAFGTLGMDEAREFGAILERGVDAVLDGRPRREITREGAREAYRLALQQLSDADRQTFVRIAGAEDRTAEELCWGTRTLYSLVMELEDRALAASFAIALTEMPPE